MRSQPGTTTNRKSNPFVMTPTERIGLALYRGGYSSTLAARLSGCGSNGLSRAIEKEQSEAAWQTTLRQCHAPVSLKRAHGRELLKRGRL